MLQHGFKGECLDLEVDDAQLKMIMKYEEELLKKLVELNANKSGCLFILCCQVVNQRTVMQTRHAMMGEARTIERKQAQSKKQHKDATKQEAIASYKNFIAWRRKT